MPVPTKAPTKPRVEPDIKPEPARRYNPKPDHCPAQWERTVRRIRQV